MKSKLFLLMLGLIFLIGIVSATVTVTLNSPENNSASFSDVTFNCSAETDSGYLNNISLFTNQTGSWVNNQTINLLSYIYNDTNTTTVSTSFILVKNITNINMMVKNYTNSMWGQDGYQSKLYLRFAYTNETIINTSTQVEGGLEPVFHLWSSPVPNMYVKWIEVWMSGTSGRSGNEGFDNVTLVTNSSSQTFDFNLTGKTLWNCFACDNNSVCSYAALNRTVDYNTLLNSHSYNTTSYETSTESYVLNITPTGYTPTNAKLIYNGTSYSATITANGNNYILSKTLQINSSSIGTNTFYYTWNKSSTTSETSNTYTQTISDIQFGLCNASLTIPYLNFTFKDESTGLWTNATIPSSEFVYYLGDGTINKTFTYSQTVNKTNYTFCFLPANKTYYINPYIQYKFGTDYPQRIYDPNLGTYTNSTTNITLNLLSSTDGIYVTFQTVNTAGQTLSGVEVKAYKISGSTQTLVASGTTSSSGSVTFWLNPDFEHLINFSKTGYSVYTFQEPPTQSSYTIILSSSVENLEDYRQGITLSKTPTNSSLEENSENDFTFTINSTHYDLTTYYASLYFGNGTFISTSSGTTTTGGTLTFSNINITNQSIYMNYNYTINVTTLTGKYYWLNSGTQGREFSIWHFFQDFELYTTSGDGLFGLDNFGRGIIAIIFIVLIVGTVGYRYGFNNEAMVCTLIFGIVLFLDTMNFIPKPDFIGIVPLDNFLTIITGIIMVGFILKEELR